MATDEMIAQDIEQAKELIDSDCFSPPTGQFMDSKALNDIASTKSVSALAGASMAWYSTVGFSRIAIMAEGIRLGRELGQSGQACRVSVGQYAFFFKGNEREVATQLLSLPSSWEDTVEEIRGL